MKSIGFLALCLAFSATVFPSEIAVRDIGIPVKGVSWVRLHPGKTEDGRASLLATMGQNNGGLFVVDIDLTTGHCRQFPVKNGAHSTFPTAAYRSLRSGVLYIGSAWDAHLHRFDANHPERGIEDLGAIDPDGANFPTGITEGADGAIWIGAHPGARLARYEPATEKFTRFGKMDGQDQYLYPLAGDDGSLAAIVKVIRPHVVLIDPASGEPREAGPAITDLLDTKQFLTLITGVDRRLYLDSHAGQFRIDGLNLTAVPKIPAPLPGIPVAGRTWDQAPLVMPGGWTAQFLDANDTGSGTPRTILLTNIDPLVPSRRLHLDWTGGGSNLFVIDAGPGGDIYGSSYLPNLLFRVSRDGEQVENLGKHSLAMGEAYSLTELDGKVWLGSYPDSRLSVYDPARPLHFGTEPGDNPRDVGRLDDVACRPNALIATPDGRLWMGSGPNYGLYDGTLAWYDPATGAKKSHRGIVPQTSPSALLYLPALKQILVGLSIEGGTGTKVQRLNGGFALWDPAKDELAWTGDLGLENLADITALVDAGDGLVYAMIGRGDHILSQGAPAITPRIVLFDPVARKVIASAWLPEDYGPLAWHGHFTLRRGPDAIYGATAHCIFRIKPGTCDVERIWQESWPQPRTDTVWMTASDPNVIDVLGPILGQKLYFSTGSTLRELTLPK